MACIAPFRRSSLHEAADRQSLCCNIGGLKGKFEVEEVNNPVKGQLFAAYSHLAEILANSHRSIIISGGRTKTFIHVDIWLPIQNGVTFQNMAVLQDEVVCDILRLFILPIWRSKTGSIGINLAHQTKTTACRHDINRFLTALATTFSGSGFQRNERRAQKMKPEVR